MPSGAKWPTGIWERRLPTSSEVWKDYRQAGSSPPDVWGEPAIRSFLERALGSVDLPNNRPWQRKAALVGSLQYELGIALHGRSPLLAARYFQQALRSLQERCEFSPEAQIEQHTLFTTIHLLHARTTGAERHQRTQQIQTVQSMGKKLVEGVRQFQGLDEQQRSLIWGRLAEMAFAATFLTAPQPSTYVGAPTAKRQRAPLSGEITVNTAIPSIQTTEVTDFNLYGYVGPEPQPVSVTRVQVETTTRERDELYNSEILCLYLGRDLGIYTNAGMEGYGFSLSAYTGKPSPRSAKALDNIGQAQEAHHYRLYGSEQ